ncbi:MAG: rRNA cytosine-C5-methyltransferase [Bacteroidaceae bacterium]|nr:rRNA cytosine-C5-methyltransferase [Bacteroidaceae bacterium]
MEFPADFVALMREHLGPERAGQLLAGLQEAPSVSIRLNSAKTASKRAQPSSLDLPSESRLGKAKTASKRAQPSLLDLPSESRLGEAKNRKLQLRREGLTPIPWCAEGYWLDERPAFTFDPLLHAGAYYVQEASSMYLDEVLRRFLPPGTLVALDLCAAPGGKSTVLRHRLSDDSLLVSNEPMRPRAQILAENLIKWGHPATVVTQNFPDDFRHLPDTFHLIVADVPCSGEGMFRKDEGAVADWSLDNVARCWQRQRDIVSAIWPTLKEGGLFIYSTCTFNRFEDEDNVRWIAEQLGASVLEERHFFPGIDRGEGFYIAALRKNGQLPAAPVASKREQPSLLDLPSKSRLGQKQPQKQQPIAALRGDYVVQTTATARIALPALHAPLMQKLLRTMQVLVAGVQLEEAKAASKRAQPSSLDLPSESRLGEAKGRDWQPSHALALSTALVRGVFPEVELSYDLALAYLRREALRIDAPRGYVLVTYQGLPLGFVKSVGNRANNLYPQEWRIRTTYTQPAVPLLTAVPE